LEQADEGSEGCNVIDLGSPGKWCGGAGPVPWVWGPPDASFGF